MYYFPDVAAKLQSAKIHSGIKDLGGGVAMIMRVGGLNDEVRADAFSGPAACAANQRHEGSLGIRHRGNLCGGFSRCIRGRRADKRARLGSALRDAKSVL